MNFDGNFNDNMQNQSINNNEFMGDNSSCCNPCMMNNNMCMTNPIYECPEERVCHRYICYDVPHIKPCNTKIINHHVYRHTFSPCYTCCEENVVENIYGPRCC